MSKPATEVKPLILVIDDEPQIRRLLTHTLEAAGYRVETAATGADGGVAVAQVRPELVLLDLGLPDLNGLDVLRRLRDWSSVPVIILTVQDDERDKIAALDAGANDYVTKPFSPGELLARIRVALRPARSGVENPVVQCGPLTVDLATGRTTVQGREVSLTVTESKLLKLLARHSGRVLTHRFLLREVWGPQAESQTAYLRVYLVHLRNKIEADPSDPRLLLTEPGVGYRLQPPEEG